MSTALYRRYRPESFTELIGQTQVTVPLMAALKSDRVNHAYLFSGPRGCGKTTSARILARCLNCAEGPTDTPCGKCASCIELSRDGSGSLDVIEIDAASHNKVEDARELRERIAFAPSRDRYKIFILDEAHMVTKDGFNALLKVVEEPPAHVKFIFATTEPEKVISTIRSRTHHYPFRLVPPAQMLEYLAEMCASENVKVDEGVLSLVVRSGGGSVRDSLSLLDQLIAGSENNHVTYERAVGLLGYTDSALLDSVIDAFAAGDAAEVFSSVDRVIQSGQDPHRFVEDLLERVRDLIVVGSVGLAAKNVLRDIPADQLERMRLQVERFGKAELTYAAEVISEGLTRMNGATSPKLQLELMVSKVLVPAQDSSETGSLARIERLERRMGLGGNAPTNSAPVAAQVAATPITVQAESAGGVPAVSWDVMQSSWGDVMTKLASISRSAWQVVLPQTPIGFDGEVLDIRFANDHDMKVFKDGGTSSPSEILRKAIFEVLGVRAKYRAVTANTGEPVVQVSIPKQEPVSIKKQEPVALVTEPIAKVEEKIQEVNQNRNKLIDEDAQMGDSVLRNVLGAEPIEDN
ncbi:MAG: DNA polymerase III subunit gamma and tau [Micrococcales bacterium]|nr:DNA polymerase III subunit gamma and tau [Actinomycetota bacterium]NCA08129.1 DNA polymerase III subunit gamma and tau [Micrococcales bacterium]